MLRLRQLALVATELRPIEHEVCAKLGLEVCYRDPGLAYFGLRHGMYAIGDRLLEVVAPKESGTTAGRFLERRGGDGGYMILLQTNDIDRERSRVTDAGIRIIHDGGRKQAGTSIHGIHLHPKDVGGAILSIDQAGPAESWLWAGHDWRYHSLDGVVTDMVAVTVQAEEPAAMAERWATAVGRPASDDVIELDDSQIRFVESQDDRGDGLVSADLVAADRNRTGETFDICGLTFNLV